MSNAIEIASLFAVLEADDRLTGQLDTADNQIQKLGKRIDKIGDSMSIAGGKLSVLTEPLKRFGLDGIATASDFDSAMKEISARTGVVGDDLERVRNLALQMGADTVFSAQESADAFLELLASGQSAEEAIATLPVILQAAAASGEDLGTTADTITDIMAAFGLGVEDAAGVVNILAKAAGASSADMGSLGQGFANVGGVAKNFGLSVEDTAAVLAVFSENGIKGAEAGTALKSMLLNMTRPTDKVKGLWNELGISFYDAAGNTRDLSDVIKDLNRVLDPMPAEQQNEIMQKLAGSYGIVGLTALMGSISIDDMQGKMRDAATAGEVAEARMDTFAGAMDSLHGSIETFQINALTPLMEDGLKPLAQRGTEIINMLTDWAVQNPETATTIILVLGAVTALGPVLLGLGAIFGVVSMAVTGLGGAIAFLLSPIGLAIAAAVAIGAAYATNFGGIRDFIDNEVRPRLEAFFNFLGDVWETVRPALESIFNWFMTEGLPAISNFIQNEVLPRVQDFFNFISGVWELVRPALESIFTWFMEEGLPAISKFIDETVRPVVEGFFNFIAGIWDLIGPILGSMLDWFVTSGLPAIQKIVEDVWNNVFKPFVEFLKGIWTAVEPGFTAFKEGVEQALEPIITIINDIKSALGEIGGRAGALGGAGENASIIAEKVSSGEANAGDVFSAFFQAVSSEFTGAAIQPVNSRDSGGDGVAGQTYLIGTGAQPELFTAPANGTFTPNAGKAMGGNQIGQLIIYANDRAGGRAAADGFDGRMKELDRARG